MNLSLITEAKKAAHVLAGAGVVALGWAVSEQGQAVIGGIVHAYPKASFITGVVGFLATVYFSPKSKPIVAQ